MENAQPGGHDAAGTIDKISTHIFDLARAALTSGVYQPEILTVPEAAKYLRISESQLHQLRNKVDGPPVCKIGASVRYRRNDLNAWLDELSAKANA